MLSGYTYSSIQFAYLPHSAQHTQPISTVLLLILYTISIVLLLILYTFLSSYNFFFVYISFFAFMCTVPHQHWHMHYMCMEYVYIMYLIQAYFLGFIFHNLWSRKCVMVNRKFCLTERNYSCGKLVVLTERRKSSKLVRFLS